jgi:hypothetical protein
MCNFDLKLLILEKWLAKESPTTTTTTRDEKLNKARAEAKAEEKQLQTNLIPTINTINTHKQTFCSPLFALRHAENVKELSWS